jgi:iron(II)-dependent oxidoreductase
MARINAGPFLTGSDDGPEDEWPMHKIPLAEFYIDRDQVTNAEFVQFLDAVGTESARGEKYFDSGADDARVHRRNGRWLADRGHENRLVVQVSWFGAAAFCSAVGKGLPTEAEWERAARRVEGRKIPWGNESSDATNGATSERVFDLAGNGCEWGSSAHRPYPYNAVDGREDLSEPQARVTRGGGQDSPADELTATHRGQHVSRNFRSASTAFDFVAPADNFPTPNF